MQEMLDQPLDKEFIDELDRDGDGQIDKGEFLEAMLIRLGKVTKEDTYPIMKKFSQLDQDGSGFLDEGVVPIVGPVGDRARPVEQGKFKMSLPGEGLPGNGYFSRVVKDLRGRPCRLAQAGNPDKEAKDEFCFHGILKVDR